MNGAGQSIQQITARLSGVVLMDVGRNEMSIKFLDVIGADVLLQLVNAHSPVRGGRAFRYRRWDCEDP